VIKADHLFFYWYNNFEKWWKRGG